MMHEAESSLLVVELARRTSGVFAGAGKNKEVNHRADCADSNKSKKFQQKRGATPLRGLSDVATNVASTAAQAVFFESPDSSCKMKS